MAPRPASSAGDRRDHVAYRTGMARIDLPERFGSWEDIHNRLYLGCPRHLGTHSDSLLVQGDPKGTASWPSPHAQATKRSTQRATAPSARSATEGSKTASEPRAPHCSEGPSRPQARLRRRRKRAAFLARTRHGCHCLPDRAQVLRRGNRHRRRRPPRTQGPGNGHPQHPRAGRRPRPHRTLQAGTIRLLTPAGSTPADPGTDQPQP